jgi:hypothetical protein
MEFSPTLESLPASIIEMSHFYVSAGNLRSPHRSWLVPRGHACIAKARVFREDNCRPGMQPHCLGSRSLTLENRSSSAAATSTPFCSNVAAGSSRRRRECARFTAAWPSAGHASSVGFSRCGGTFHPQRLKTKARRRPPERLVMPKGLSTRLGLKVSYRVSSTLPYPLPAFQHGSVLEYGVHEGREGGTLGQHNQNTENEETDQHGHEPPPFGTPKE